MADPATRPRPSAPPTPVGWEVGPPDFVGVGTARSGTTWWDGLIASHPDGDLGTGLGKDERIVEQIGDGPPEPALVAATEGAG